MNDIFKDEELPKLGETNVLEEFSETEFENLVLESKCFQVQFKDRKDYGTDYNLEAKLSEKYATNVRVSVQLKATEGNLNRDGSLSVQVARTNLNYLASQPYSVYVAYHKPTNKLYVAECENVIFNYESHGDTWRSQSYVTIGFTKEFDENYLLSLRDRVLSYNKNTKTGRLAIATSSSDDLVKTISIQPSAIVVPSNEERAAELLSALSEANKDQVISDNFEAFLTILKENLTSLQQLYFAEINLGIEGFIYDRDRILGAINILNTLMDAGEFGYTLYNLGNAYSVLNDFENSTSHFKLAILRLEEIGDHSAAAMAYKNLGTNYENVGQFDEAEEFYKKALDLEPNLAEAHFALGIKNIKEEDYNTALDHFDKITFIKRHAKHTGSVQGWRITALFNSGDARGAFREVFALTSYEENKDWAWGWCGKQVHLFGFDSPENLRRSIQFWENFETTFPDHSLAKMQLVLCKNKLLETESTPLESNEFEEEVLAKWNSDSVDKDHTALIFDRIGHRHQKSSDWHRASEFFKLAYTIDPESYSCCLATAYNHLNMWDDALETLLPHAEFYSSDDIYWFQRATAYSHLGDYANAISGYKKAIEINEDYEKAWYNLAGNYFNAGQKKKAKDLFEVALSRFPESDLSEQAHIILKQIS